MRVWQVIPNLAFGDGIGNHVLVTDKVLKKEGYETFIFAGKIDERISSKVAKTIDKMPKLDEDDIILYRLPSGNPLNMDFLSWKCKKVLVYHNITPPYFFERYNPRLERSCRRGLQDVKRLSNSVDACIAVSEFNRDDLIELGYPKEKIWTLTSRRIPLENFNVIPDEKIFNMYQDDYTNILFVGRVVPNKKHENIIRAFAYYKKYITPKARLIFVGNTNASVDYYAELKEYIQYLELEEVYFHGHVKMEELVAIYKSAHVFLCLSEHEGFCVPLIEAMYFHLPVIAYKSSAIPETLAGSGVLLENNSPEYVAEAIDKIQNDLSFRNTVIERQNERLKVFETDTSEEELIQCIKDIFEKI